MTGQPDGRPAKVGIAINDIAAGATAIYSIMAAQMVRQRPARASTSTSRWSTPVWRGRVWEAGAYFGSGEVPAADRHAAPALHAVPGLSAPPTAT